MDYWITTHGPCLEPEDARHLFFKTGKRINVPRPADVVFIYESQVAAVEGRRVTQIHRCHLGQRTLQRVPEGRQAIIGMAVVNGVPRAIGRDDVVQDYGDFKQWSIIPCHRQSKVKELGKGDLMELLGKPRKTPPRFLRLYRIPDAVIGTLILNRLTS